MPKSPTSERVEPHSQLLSGSGLVDLSHPAPRLHRVNGRGVLPAEQLEAFQTRVSDGVLAASVAVRIGVLAEIPRSQVAEKAGPKVRHHAERTAVRRGAKQARWHQCPCTAPQRHTRDWPPPAPSAGLSPACQIFVGPAGAGRGRHF